MSVPLMGGPVGRVLRKKTSTEKTLGGCQKKHRPPIKQRSADPRQGKGGAESTCIVAESARGSTRSDLVPGGKKKYTLVEGGGPAENIYLNPSKGSMTSQEEIVGSSFSRERYLSHQRRGKKPGLYSMNRQGSFAGGEMFSGG